jgi:hypothetical protein
MRVIYRCRLTTAEAEDLITQLWHALEKNETPTPRLRVHEAGELLDLYLEFLSEEDAAPIREVMSRLVIEPSLAVRSKPVTRARIVQWRMRAAC